MTANQTLTLKCVLSKLIVVIFVFILSLSNTKTLKESPFYFAFTSGDILSVAILSQIKLIDSKRLLNKITNISQIDFEKLKEKFKALLP